MAKKAPQRRKQQQQRETNWLVIGGLIAVGVLALGGLLFLTLRPTEARVVQTLAEYCQDNKDNCVFIGEADAPITMVEVPDFGCVHCQDFHNNTAQPLKEQYVDTGDVQWVVLPYALSAATVPSAASGMCANEQGGFFPYASAMYAIEDANFRLSADGYQQAAKTAGLDLDKFTSCMKDGRNISKVNQNRDVARSVGVTGTPTFFVNNQEVNGAQPLSVFSQIFDTILSAQ